MATVSSNRVKQTGYKYIMKVHDTVSKHCENAIVVFSHWSFGSSGSLPEPLLRFVDRRRFGRRHRGCRHMRRRQGGRRWLALSSRNAHFKSSVKSTRFEPGGCDLFGWHQSEVCSRNVAARGTWHKVFYA